MNSRTAAWLAWSTVPLTMAFAALSLVFGSAGDPTQFSGGIVPTLGLVLSAALGALIAARRPDNPIGWIFCAVALLRALEVFARNYASYTLVTAPGSLPGGVAMAWLGLGWLGRPGPVVLSTILLLIFPTGHLPSPRWRVVAWAGAGGRRSPRWATP